MDDNQDSDFRSLDNNGQKGKKHCSLDTIEIPNLSLFPEGVTVDPHTRRLYMGGAADGSVMTLSPCKTDPEFVAPPGTFRNVIGVQWDAERELLWVCNNDLSFTSSSTIDLLDPGSGSVVASHDFAAVGFCNDVVFVDGDAYVTDSLGHRVVRVAAADALANTPVETWAAAPEFNAGPGFSLNGITWDGDRFYVAYIADGTILALDVDGGGAFAGVTEISLDAGPLAGPDGLYWRGDDTLLLVESGTHRISTITLDGDTGTLDVIDDQLSFPTTAAVIGDAAWVLEGELDHMFGINPNPPDLPAKLVRVDL